MNDEDRDRPESAEDAEAVSLRDIQMILAPGKPPPMSRAVAARAEAAPVPSPMSRQSTRPRPRIGGGDLDSQDLSAFATLSGAPPPMETGPLSVHAPAPSPAPVIHSEQAGPQAETPRAPRVSAGPPPLPGGPPKPLLPRPIAPPRMMPSSSDLSSEAAKVTLHAVNPGSKASPTTSLGLGPKRPPPAPPPRPPLKSNPALLDDSLRAPRPQSKPDLSQERADADALLGFTSPVIGSLQSISKEQAQKSQTDWPELVEKKSFQRETGRSPDDADRTPAGLIGEISSPSGGGATKLGLTNVGSSKATRLGLGSGAASAEPAPKAAPRQTVDFDDLFGIRAVANAPAQPVASRTSTLQGVGKAGVTAKDLGADLEAAENDASIAHLRDARIPHEESVRIDPSVLLSEPLPFNENEGKAAAPTVHDAESLFKDFPLVDLVPPVDPSVVERRANKSVPPPPLKKRASLPEINVGPQGVVPTSILEEVMRRGSDPQIIEASPDSWVVPPLTAPTGDDVALDESPRPSAARRGPKKSGKAKADGKRDSTRPSEDLGKTSRSRRPSESPIKASSAPPHVGEGEGKRSKAPLILITFAVLLGSFFLVRWVADRNEKETTAQNPETPTTPTRAEPKQQTKPPTPTPGNDAKTDATESSTDTRTPSKDPVSAPTDVAPPVTPAHPNPDSTATPTTPPTSAPTTTAPTSAPTPTAAPTAAPQVSTTGGAFDRNAASSALAGAVGAASGCKQGSDPSGVAHVTVTFVPSGRVTSANVSGPPYAGTATGGCIARTFRGISVPPFDGDPVTVSKTIEIP